MKVLLLADNDPIFVEDRTEFLENAGYTVVTASSPEEARHILENQRVQLALLDIRLRDDLSEDDISGLELAQDAAFRPLTKMILTGFPSTEAARAALKHYPTELPPAVDILSKKDGPEAMVRAVEEAFAESVHLNWDLLIDVDSQQQLSFLHLAGLLQPGLPNEVLVQRAAELEDLFRKLFFEYRHIRLDRVFWRASGRFCLWVLAQSPQAATDARLVVCSERHRLHEELRRLRELAPSTVQGFRLPEVTETVHYAMTAYALPEVDLETPQSLRDLFELGRERPLRTTFDHLLKEVLPPWHQHGQLVEGRDLMALYRQWVGLGEGGLPRSDVEHRVEAVLQASRALSAVEIERHDGSIRFRFPNEPPRACPDPLAQVFEPLEQPAPVVCRISPGRLTADNILVASDQHACLTDFAHSGQAPQWWDFVCLEAILRFELSQAPDLLAWLEFEECLLRPARLHDDLGRDVLADLRTSVALIEQIRRQAGSETGPEVLPYYAGLLVWAVGAIARYEPNGLYTPTERQRGAHLLLAAALISRRMSLIIHKQKRVSGSPATEVEQQPGHALRLDEDGFRVWIGPERVVALTGQELELYLCLYEQTPKAVPRKTLIERVFRKAYKPGNEQLDNSLNSLIQRLRDKIEPNPNTPRYILTVRGKGYRLETDDTTSA